MFKIDQKSTKIATINAYLVPKSYAEMLCLARGGHKPHRRWSFAKSKEQSKSRAYSFETNASSRSCFEQYTSYFQDIMKGFCSPYAHRPICFIIHSAFRPRNGRGSFCSGLIGTTLPKSKARISIRISTLKKSLSPS